MKFPILLGVRGGHVTHFGPVRWKWNLLGGILVVLKQSRTENHMLLELIPVLLVLAGAAAATSQP